jgi:rhodanese-related sulfurtransferase
VSGRFASVEEMLADARSRISRLSPQQAVDAIGVGARLVDIRPSWQRRQEGEIPGALIVERNHLEWRLHPRSDARVPAAVEGQRWIVVCVEGYTSSLAADALTSLGIPATDIVGGYAAWRADGLPTRPGETPIEQIVPS